MANAPYNFDFHTARDARFQGTNDRHLRRQHGLMY